MTEFPAIETTLAGAEKPAIEAGAWLERPGTFAAGRQRPASTAEPSQAKWRARSGRTGLQCKSTTRMGRAFFMVVISPVVRWIAHQLLTNLRIRVGAAEVAEALGKRRSVCRSCGPIGALHASRLMVPVWLRLGGK
jgi:hypothetical protein